MAALAGDSTTAGTSTAQEAGSEQTASDGQVSSNVENPLVSSIPIYLLELCHPCCRQVTVPFQKVTF